MNHGPIARAAILLASAWTSGLQLWVPDSLAHRAAGEGELMDLINVGLLLLVALGAADLVWHDIRGRLLWPSFPNKARHYICMWLYSILAAGFGVRAFLATGSDPQAVLQVGLYYLIFAGVILGEAYALMRETRPEDFHGPD